MMPRPAPRCCRPGEPCGSPGAPWHGTENGYGNYRCRCPSCTAAHSEYYRTGPGAAARLRYRAALLGAGLTVRSSWVRPEIRQLPYRRRSDG
jgi:hypothetical protein